ncbi:MAG: CCA tRNA nucleotidyltransferase [Desulfurococcales archaeon]|nr:CCA tRNA nucleotidyltransferase [Desulfurococcales archaeon]
MGACPRGRVEEEALEAIRPGPLQLRLLEAFYSMLKRRLEACILERGIRALVEAEGSYAKGTLTSDKWELDVFLLVEGASAAWIKSRGEGLLLECLRGLPVEARYAEHPYVTVRLMGLEADVVIAPRVPRPGAGGTGVERTPFHTRWVREQLERNPCLADDVRLFKAFLKGIGAYGAETRVGGFSGLLAEVLVIYHGGFRLLLEEATHWRPGSYVDPLGLGDEAALRARYPDSPLIVPDPVDPRRNAAAAVTTRRLAELVVAAAAYLERPCTAYYKPSPRPWGPYYKPDPARVAALELLGDYAGEPRDALWGRLTRLASWLAGGLGELGFEVARWEVDTDEATRALVAIELASPAVPGLQLSRGPPAWSVRRALGYIARRAGQGLPYTIAGDGTLRGLRPRRYTRASEALEWLASRPDAPLPRGTREARVHPPGSPGAVEAAALIESRTPSWPLCLALQDA